MEIPTRRISDIYCCPECGGEIDYRETVNSGRMWFCMKCAKCTSFETELRKIRAEPVETIVEMPRPELTEEEKVQGKKILAHILVM